VTKAAWSSLLKNTSFEQKKAFSMGMPQLLKKLQMEGPAGMLNL